MRRIGSAALLLGLMGIGAGCASSECNFNSQCGDRHYCRMSRCAQDCYLDTDCPTGKMCNAVGQCVMGVDGGVPQDAGAERDAGVPTDATPPPPVDAGPPPVDAGPPPVDAGPPPVDAGPPPMDGGTHHPTGGYLDRCTAPSDCVSGLCEPDVGASDFCSRSCASNAGCAVEQVCAGSVCVHDDTGTPCTAASTCALGLCVGSTATGGACTRTCTSAADCPAGYACTGVATAGGGTTDVCVDIEKPCTTGADCPTGMCLTAQGCTAPCRTTADCPARLAGLGPYQCMVAYGSSSPICVPPSDIIGPRAIGAACGTDSMGQNQCRSDVCDNSAPAGAMCTQACTSGGGCGPGFGCEPIIDSGSVTLVCERAGNGALGAPCSAAADCDSALCDTSHHCTRLCDDGLCPTGWTCQPVPGATISICRP